MNLYRRHRRLTVWLAAWALLLTALAPAMTQWLMSRSAGPALWAEWCITPSSSWQGATDPTPDTDPASHDAQAHCPACLQPTQVPGLPPADHPVVLASPDHMELPRLCLQAPRAMFAWTPLLARAPPALS